MQLKKRISGNILLIVLVTVVLLSLLFFFQLNNYLTVQIKDEMSKTRITIVNDNGLVVYDNYVDASVMGNHLDRPEIISAFEKGYGQSARASATLQQHTNYFATKISDDKVLRLAITTDSIYGLLFGILPMYLLILAFVLLISIYMSKRLSSNIITPINNISFDEDVEIYDELTPFMHKINLQNTEISNQLQSLDNRAATMKAITENMKEGLILLDSKGVILSANKSALHLFNETKAYAGKNILELTRNTQILENVKIGLLGSHGDVVSEISGKIYHIFVSPVENRGAIILFLDISEKAKAEKMRREFSANVSHELKTPLTTISGYAEMMHNGMVKSEDINSFSGKIKEEAARLIALIEDIIKLSELDENTLQKDFINMDVTALAKLVLERLESAAKEKNITLSLVGKSQGVFGNKAMLDELLFNLMDNAIKYNRPNGSVEVTIEPVQGKVKITVSDTGIGIKKEHLERIFERFYRVDKSRSKKTGGTGLGLSIVKHIAEYHGGKIETESNEQGTKMRVWL